MRSWRSPCALGEFGATLMFAGNMEGRTPTLASPSIRRLESDLGTARVLSGILTCWRCYCSWSCALVEAPWPPALAERERPGLSFSLRASRGDFALIVGDVLATGVVCVLGPNGAGKNYALARAARRPCPDGGPPWR